MECRRLARIKCVISIYKELLYNAALAYRVPKVGTISLNYPNMNHKLMLPRGLVGNSVYRRINRIRYIRMCTYA